MGISKLYIIKLKKFITWKPETFLKLQMWALKRSCSVLPPLPVLLCALGSFSLCDSIPCKSIKCFPLVERGKPEYEYV